MTAILKNILPRVHTSLRARRVRIEGVKNTLIVSIPGLSEALVPRMPTLASLAAGGGLRALEPVFPSVPAVAQATYLTGLEPERHGAVGHAWYDRDLAEVLAGRQAESLVFGEKVWEAGRRIEDGFTCAKLFWDRSEHGTADWTVGRRPAGPGLETFAAPTRLGAELLERLGAFPKGPAAESLAASRWIARCAAHVLLRCRPTLTLVRLPALEEEGQRLGPADPGWSKIVRALDRVLEELLDTALQERLRILVLSEYVLEPVHAAIPLNRVLRSAGLLRTRSSPHGELLDPGASEAFAVPDRQIAHVYLKRLAGVPAVKSLLEGVPGVERVLDPEALRQSGLAHARAGDLLAVAKPDCWFCYPYWEEGARPPLFARTRAPLLKPGADPCELIVERRWLSPASWLGAETSIDPLAVRGSFGRGAPGAVLVSSEPELPARRGIAPRELKSLMLSHVFGGRVAEPV
jgi:predicted AlkP superfamily pyrophosphatase or phosphodiesterase